ncbi:MAG: hypothetical protein WC786_00925 [Patescibacteria group bacterium]
MFGIDSRWERATLLRTGGSLQMPCIHQFSWDQNGELYTVAWLSTNVQLSDRAHHLKLIDQKSSEPSENLVIEISKIHGVQDVKVDRYKVRIERTSLVPWPSICSEVQQVISIHLAKLNAAPNNGTPTA